VVRVAFTVALMVAIAGIVIPATEYAGVQRSDTETRDAVEHLIGEARVLVDGNDALAPDTAPARHAVTLDLPTDGFASAALENFSIDPVPKGTSVTWRVEGGTAHSVLVDGIRIRPQEDGRFELGGGRVQVVLELVAIDGRTVVRIRREG